MYAVAISTVKLIYTEDIHIDFDHSGWVDTLHVRYDIVHKYVSYTGLIHSTHSISVNLRQHIIANF